MTATTPVAERPAHSWELPDALWTALAENLIDHNTHRGRPRTVDRHKIAAGIYYVLRTGVQWQALPREQFGPPSTVYYYFRQWADDGVFEGTWATVLGRYNKAHGLDWEWQSVDGAMNKAPLGGGKNRPQSDRPGEGGDEAQPVGGR